MKLMKKTLLASAIAASMITSGAYAAEVANPAAVGTYGATLPNEADRAAVAVTVTTTMDAGEALNVDDSFKVTLPAGATFDANPTLLEGALAGATFALIQGGAGESFATFRVNDDSTTPEGTLVVTADVDASALADNSGIISGIEMQGFVGGVATALYGSPLSDLTVDFAPLNSSVVTPTSGIFDVATGFQELVVDGPGTATVSKPFEVAVTPVAAVDGDLVLTVNGPMGGVDEVSIGGNIFTIDLANNVAVSDPITYMEIASATKIVNVKFTFDDTVAHDVSTYTVDVDFEGDVNFADSSVSAGDLAATFTRNGASFASNSVGPLNKLTVSDRSGAIVDGAISITAYDTAGTEIACTGLSIDPLTSNGSVTIQGEDISTACPGAKRIEGGVNSTAIIVTNVKKTADGATATPGLSTGSVVGI